MRLRPWVWLGASIALASAETRAEPPISSGTGIVVTSEGHVVTNAHVVKSCGKVVIRVSGVAADAEIVAKDTRNDIAVLKAKIDGISPAPLRVSKIRTGETVVVFGYPLSSTLASSGNVTTGIIAALSGMNDDTSQMQISAAIQPGNSGGPVMDAGGRVIGIVVSKLDAITAVRKTGDIPQNVNFAIKSSMVTAFLSANDIPYETVQPGDDRAIPDVVDAARNFTAKIECYEGSLVATQPEKTNQQNSKITDKNKDNKDKNEISAETIQIPYKTIDAISFLIAETFKRKGTGEAARKLQESHKIVLSDKSMTLDAALATVSVDFALFILHTEERKKNGLPPYAFFYPDAILSRANAVFDKFSIKKDGRNELIAKLIDAGAAAISIHLRK